MSKSIIQVVECCLAHAKSNSTVAAYNRGEMVDCRRAGDGALGRLPRREGERQGGGHGFAGEAVVIRIAVTREAEGHPAQMGRTHKP